MDNQCPSTYRCSDWILEILEWIEKRLGEGGMATAIALRKNRTQPGDTFTDIVVVIVRE